ncbi:MAG TPA: single-stranded DNA-binding protein [Epsilonproteobacteria bacterium]|nr:single-stranded DNA-binding protein [Campylobacterota bacterium]
MFNKVILAGNLARDIEVRYSGQTAIGNTAIATNRKYKTSTGELKEEVMFIDITFWGRTAEVAHQYLKKGSQVLIEGRLVLDSWTDKEGQKRSKHSISVETLQMLGGREANANSYNQPAQQQPAQQQAPQQQSHQVPEIDINDDEIPF